MSTPVSLARADGLLSAIIRDELQGAARESAWEEEEDERDANATHAFDFGGDAATPPSPIGAAIDAASEALTRRGVEATLRAKRAERDAAREMREAKAALDAVVLDVKSSDARVEAYERAIAAKDLELFKKEALVATLSARLEKLEANAARVARASEDVDNEDDANARDDELERANARAIAAEDGARAMREALKTFETTSAREKVALKDELREARAAVLRYGEELERVHTRERAQSHGSASSHAALHADLTTARRELASTTKKLEVSAAVNAKLESLAAQRAEELFNITQERDALKKKLRTTCETIDALEKDWIEFSQRGEDEQSALRAENEELNALVDALKESEKAGFAQSEDEICLLREELDAMRESAPQAMASAQANRSVDRRLARESIATLRGTIRDLRNELDSRDVMIEEMKRASAHHATLEAVHAEKDNIIRALQEQINATSSAVHAFDSAPTTAAAATTYTAVAIQPTDVNALDELQTVASMLRRENTKLRVELDAVDPALFEESITLKRRITAQDMLLNSYEERLVRYAAALGIPFIPEPRP